MRLFAALVVSEPARSTLVALLGELRARGWPVRWIRDDGLHVTLKFFGAVELERTEAIKTALADAVKKAPPLPLATTELGAFPAWRRARVLWVGLEGPAALELLAHRVESAAVALGFPLEAKTFRPHVTLGRVRDGAALTPHAVSDLSARRLESDFVADRLVLYESELGPGGSRYHPRASFDLAG